MLLDGTTFSNEKHPIPLNRGNSQQMYTLRSQIRPKKKKKNEWNLLLSVTKYLSVQNRYLQ